MNESLEHQRHAAIARRIDPQSTLLRTWQLTGGVSAEVTALEIERADGQRQKLLVRQHGPVDLAHNPHIARDEFRLLEIAGAHGLVTPAPYFFDESATTLTSPFVVIEFIDGDTDFAPVDQLSYVQQMAAHLAMIHRVPATADLAFLPEQDRGFGPRPNVLDDSMNERQIRHALERAWPVAQVNPSVLLHGDYWPGNILWRDGEIAAIIDWEDARTGDPLSDLGNCRFELFVAFGADAMDSFTSHYRSLSAVDFTNLAYWELVAALRPCGRIGDWGLDAETERRMRERHREFASRAMERLATG